MARRKSGQKGGGGGGGKATAIGDHTPAPRAPLDSDVTAKKKRMMIVHCVLKVSLAAIVE